MDRMEVIKILRAAKYDHINCISYVHGLIIGLPLKKENIPVPAAECDFGKWFYGEGKVLLKIDALRAIEQPHIDLHHTYQEILDLLFSSYEGNKGWDQREGKRNQNNTDINYEKIDNLYQKLKRQADDVINLLSELEYQLI